MFHSLCRSASSPLQSFLYRTSSTGTSTDISTPSTPANPATASKRPAILPHKFFACQAVR